MNGNTRLIRYWVIPPKANALLGDRGRLIIRPSGTEPVIRVMGEAEDKALVDSLVSNVCDAVAAAT